jgi:FtsP/CotA-like multicopper oxidase with cupredoxin domain
MRSMSVTWALRICVLLATAAIGGAAADPVVLAGSPPERVAANPATGQGGQSGQPFSNPPEIASQNGLLSATLTVGPAELTVAGQNVTFPALYDGLYTPPVLRVQPGDTVQLLLNNFAQLPTNVHYHGLNVTRERAGTTSSSASTRVIRSNTISRSPPIIARGSTGTTRTAIRC